MTIGVDEEIPVDDVAALGARRLAQIIVDHAYHDAGLLQAVRMALAATGSNDDLGRALASEIDAVRSNHHFYSYRESPTLAREIDRIRRAIMHDLLPHAPQLAAALLERLIRLDGHVFEHADDSDGVIGDAIRDAVLGFGRAWAAVPDRNPHRLAALVFDLFVQNDYAVHQEVIRACKDALGDEGLAELECLIRTRFDSGDDRRLQLVHGLAEIADARGDVDGFIAAQQLGGDGSAAHAIREIVERLASVGRLAEALQWLEEADRESWHSYDFDELRIGLLDRLGRADEAQAIRWTLFLRSISATILEDYLGRLPVAMRAAAVQKAIAVAQQHRNPHAALSLLVKLDPPLAADLVLCRLGELSGDAYSTLRDAAECLAKPRPLASVLLYRKLADTVLTRAQSQHYGRAVRDLASANSLAAGVRDWLGHLPQEAYRKQIAEQHKQKSAFWKRMSASRLDWRSEASGNDAVGGKHD
jgi:hypothetical protein